MQHRSLISVSYIICSSGLSIDRKEKETISIIVKDRFMCLYGKKRWKTRYSGGTIKVIYQLPVKIFTRKKKFQRSTLASFFEDPQECALFRNNRKFIKKILAFALC